MVASIASPTPIAKPRFREPVATECARRRGMTPVAGRRAHSANPVAGRNRGAPVAARIRIHEPVAGWKFPQPAAARQRGYEPVAGRRYPGPAGFPRIRGGEPVAGFRSHRGGPVAGRGRGAAPVARRWR